MITNYLFLQAAESPGIFASMWPLLLIIVVFYFFIIRPQQKKAKEQNNFIASLEKGSQIVTASGIIGRINKIEDNILTLQIDSKTFIKVTKSSVSKELTESIPASATEGF
jgi:preprotein translocase subunit YajC